MSGLGMHPLHPMNPYNNGAPVFSGLGYEPEPEIHPLVVVLGLAVLAYAFLPH